MEREKSQNKQLRVSRDAQVRRLQKLKLTSVRSKSRSSGSRPQTTASNRPQTTSDNRVILAKEDHKVQEYQQEGDSYKRKVFLSRCTFIKLLLRTTCKNRIYGIFYYIYNKYIN